MDTAGDTDGTALDTDSDSDTDSTDAQLNDEEIDTADDYQEIEENQAEVPGADGCACSAIGGTGISGQSLILTLFKLLVS